MVRHIQLVLVAAALLAGVHGGASAQRQHAYRAPASVCIALTVTDQMPGPAFVTLRSEASRIWLPHGIALNWTQPVPKACAAVVPVIFDEVEVQRFAGRQRADALALTVFSGRARAVYVSLPRAFRMLQQLRETTSILVSGGERDLRGGTLLGRVVAHELGHVLLETTNHSDTGLMRPVFGLTDVLSADTRMTDLSPEESRRLAMRFSLEPINRPLDGPAVPAILARFWP